MMTYLPIIVSICSLIIAAIVGFAGVERGKRADHRKEATEMTTVIVKLENISGGISEIKSDLRNIKSEMQDTRERLVIVEQSVKSAHHRIDQMEERIGYEKD